MNNLSFSTLKLLPELVKNLPTLGYETMTPIQAQSLPLILEDKDIIAQGKTGSGKTAAFGLGLLNKLNVKQFRIQTLVLCPTRELADQVAKELRKLARGIHNIKILTLCGGTPFGPQVGSLEHGAHIIVGTPGRVEDHLRKQTLVLNNVTTLVLDEADRMLDSGFQDAIETITEELPSQRQTLLFSATYPEKIQNIAKRIMCEPVLIQVESIHDSATIEQRFYNIDNLNETKNSDSDESRLMALHLLLLQERPSSALVFCNTKHETQAVADALNQSGFSAQALHGDLEQKDRDKALVRFSNKSMSILVATDVAARGLDIENVDAVINYQLARETEVHTHRIGRTGRAGNEGLACTLYSNKEKYKLTQLADYLGQVLENEPLPSRSLLNEPSYKAPMATLQISGGKKQKVRAGDILGALTGPDGIEGKEVGKIALFDGCAFVAVQRHVATQALNKLSEGKLKGRSFRVRKI